MKEEQLNKAAIIYFANIKASYPEDVDDNTLEYECHKAFLKGALWHESLPLAERLSDVEKESIKAKYSEIKGINDMTYDLFADDTAILEWLFGTDLFTKTK